MHFIGEAIIFVFDMNVILLKAALKWLLPKKYKSIEGEICLITGAARGIGRNLAVEFATKGAILVLWDINSKGNDETAEMVREIGGRVYTYTVDISNRQEIYEAAEKVTQTVGEVNILVNNAGVVFAKDFFDLKDEEIMKTMNVNTLAQFWTCRAFLPSMMQKNHGQVVNVASTMGFMGAPGVTDYVASKHAVIGFHNALAYDIIKRGKLGVKTTLVCPHIVKTDIFNDIVPQRYPPPLELDYCVQTIMDAILTDKPNITMPRFLYFLHWMTTMLPHEAMVRAQYYYGVFDVIEEVGAVKKKIF